MHSLRMGWDTKKQIGFKKAYVGPKGSMKMRLEELQTDLYYSGDIDLLGRKVVSVIGSRKASKEGLLLASRIGRKVAEKGYVLMSGLASGVDTYAMHEAMQAGGDVIGVIGTPLEKAYPRENEWLQELVYKEHLLLSPFASGSVTHRGCFPFRNRVMAYLSDVTVVVEASETSGTRHQVQACLEFGKPVYVTQHLAQKNLSWLRALIARKEALVF